MEALSLFAGSHEGTYKLIGGEISLDFVNTVSWPGMPKEHDWLESPGNFLAWALLTGIIDKPCLQHLKAQPADKIGKEMAEIRQIRSILTLVLRPFAFGKKPSKDIIQSFNTLAQQAGMLRHIHPATLQWAWPIPMSWVEVTAPIVWNAAFIVTDVNHDRISHCPRCQWLFHDTTRNHSRKWCDMEDCGSRDKALRYYHRKKD